MAKRVSRRVIMAKDKEFKADATDGDGDGLVQDGTKWERAVGTQPDGFKSEAADGDADGKVQDGTEFERTTEVVEEVAAVEVVAEEVIVVVEEAEVVVVEAKKKPAPKKAEATPAPKVEKTDPKTTPTALGSDITVSRVKLVYKSQYEHNSRSVGVTQIRLVELGYPDAGADNRGYLGDSTLKAILEFAADHGIEASDLTNETLVKAIFQGTPVTVGI
jgi:hypothetical protein